MIISKLKSCQRKKTYDTKGTKDKDENKFLIRSNSSQKMVVQYPKSIEVEKNQTGILYLVKIFFKNKNEIMTFSDIKES